MIPYVPYKNGAFRTAPPDEQGVPSGSILRFLKELDAREVDIQSLYIFRHGYELVAANRKPYEATSLRRIYSAAKALTSLAILFSIQEGYIALDSKLVELFPEDVSGIVTERIKHLNIYHLLTMTTGHAKDTYQALIRGKNSIRAFLEEPLVYEPGTHFLYNNGVPHILGLIVKKVTGLDYIEYLQSRFLDPLDIYCTVEKTEKGELDGSKTVCTAEGFAKLSLFYLQEGQWNGKQLLDPGLVRAAGEYQVSSGRCPSISFMHTDQLCGYGFQTWRNSTEGYRLDGGRSQFGFIFPNKELAIVCNAIEDDSGLIPEILWNTLYADINREIYSSDDEKRALEKYLSKWSCAPVLAQQPSYLDDYYNRIFKMEDNIYGLEKLAVTLKDGQPAVDLVMHGRQYHLTVGLNGEWAIQTDGPAMPKENERHNEIFGVGQSEFLVSGGWATDFCFVFQIRARNWMDYQTYYFRFNGDSVSACIETNVERRAHLRRCIPTRSTKYNDVAISGHRI